jgi:FKBP-type peptidyl-prolyl cis-trans isomerase 2
METEAPKGFTFKPAYIAILAVIIAAVIGLIYMVANSNAANVTVAVGDNVSVFYTGTFTNGTVFDTNLGKQPLNFTVGTGQMIKGFDQAVIGMKVNQTKTVTLTPDEAYGPVNQSRIVTVPRSQFGNSVIAVGMQVQTQNGAVGTISAFDANTVTVDFNPALAGQTLIFTIKVVSIQK